MILFYLILAAALFAYMNVWFVIAVITKKNDVADIAALFIQASIQLTVFNKWFVN